MLYGFLGLALRLILRGDRARADDEGGQNHHQFLYGHGVLSFQNEAHFRETLNARSNSEDRRRGYLRFRRPLSRRDLPSMVGPHQSERGLRRASVVEVYFILVDQG